MPRLPFPACYAVWTAADVADIPPIDFRLSRIEGLEPYRQRLFADGFVRYVGEPVAAVFADDPYLAEDAAELVALDIEELPAILQADERPGEFEPGRSTEPAIVRKGIWRRRCRFPRRPCRGRGDAFDRAAFGRAAGNPRRDRALRCGA